MLKIHKVEQQKPSDSSVSSCGYLCPKCTKTLNEHLQCGDLLHIVGQIKNLAQPHPWSPFAYTLAGGQHDNSKLMFLNFKNTQKTCDSKC